MALARSIEQDVAVLVDDALCILTRADDPEERIEEAGRFERQLPIVFVKIEQTSLRPRVR